MKLSGRSPNSWRDEEFGSGSCSGSCGWPGCCVAGTAVLASVARAVAGRHGCSGSLSNTFLCCSGLAARAMADMGAVGSQQQFLMLCGSRQHCGGRHESCGSLSSFPCHTGLSGWCSGRHGCSGILSSRFFCCVGLSSTCGGRHGCCGILSSSLS